MQIGDYTLNNNLILAPMAGISDRPYREICRQHGAGMAVSEMITSNPSLRKHKKTRLKSNHAGEIGPIAVQILGTDPRVMADAACFNAQNGAQIIDINMGCPAKKVCSVAAGSALLKNEKLVADILESVVSAVEIPVTVKIRTGWSPESKNAVKIAQIAEQAGVSAITIHGRTRQCAFNGQAEYETIRAVKQTVCIPVIANGDINNPQKALTVLQQTGADALMIGRAAQGQPWIFEQIKHYLDNGEIMPIPPLEKIHIIVSLHLESLYTFYGKDLGVKIARKHIHWYLANIGSVPASIRSQINQCATPQSQLLEVRSAFDFFLHNRAA